MEVDLFTMSRAAEAATSPLYGSILPGYGLSNGRTERRIAVIGVISGFATLRQGLTSDTVYVDPLDAAKVMVRLDPVSVPAFTAAMTATA